MNETRNKNVLKIKGLIQLFRPDLTFTAGICVITGGLISFGSIPTWRNLILGFICGFFISASAMILNDYFDYEVDMINSPDRPLTSGIVSKGESIALTVFSTVVALTAGFCANFPTGIVCVILWIIGFLYNWKFKEAGFIGNLMVSSSVATTFILGALICEGKLNNVTLTFSAITFFLNFGEEIAGDVMDIDGDKSRSLNSVPMKIGKKAALRISGASFIIMVLISSLPVFLGYLGKSYIFVCLPFDIWALISTWKLMKSKTAEEGHTYMKWIYLSALLAIILFLIFQFIF